MQRAYAKRAVFPFSVLSAEKGKNYLLGDLCVSSPRSYLRGRAVRYRFPQVITKRDTNFKIFGYIDG
jgi:hypothetical protein